MVIKLDKELEIIKGEKNVELPKDILHFIDKQNALTELDNLDNPKRPYLRDLLYMDSIE